MLSIISFADYEQSMLSMVCSTDYEHEQSMLSVVCSTDYEQSMVSMVCVMPTIFSMCYL